MLGNLIHNTISPARHGHTSITFWANVLAARHSKLDFRYGDFSGTNFYIVCFAGLDVDRSVKNRTLRPIPYHHAPPSNKNHDMSLRRLA